METKRGTTTETLLGRKVRERLVQLGVSRRAFCLSNQISRQTLYEIEHQGKTNLLLSTLKALDEGLHWQPGTAARYASGESISRPDPAERIDEYIGRILERLSLMTVDELERESIWLEEELFGRTGTDMTDSIRMIRQAMKRIIPTFEREDLPNSEVPQGK